MKRLITSSVCILILGLFSIPQLTQAQTSHEPKVIGIEMYADWCGKCKELDPKLSKVKPEFAGKDIVFLLFDMTDEFTQEQSAFHAKLLGLTDLFNEHQGKTGYMVLLDGETKKVLHTLKSDQSEEELKEDITSILN